MTMTAQTEDTFVTVAHPFERAGLGKAPYQMLGVQHVVFQAAPGAPTQVGGSCDYCGTGISYRVNLRSACGNYFKIGCDCAISQLPKGNTLRVKIEGSVSKAKKVALAERKATLIQDARNALAVDTNLLTDQPHPKSWNGKTMRDYVNWMMINAGTAGRTKVAKIVMKAIV